MKVPGKDRKVSPQRFKRVSLADLRQGRHGKHHDTAIPIIDEVVSLPEGEALEIPLNAVDTSMATLRSALVRAATSRGLKVATYSDGATLYIWRKTAATQAYERAPRTRAKRK